MLGLSQLFAYSSLELGARIIGAKYPELLPCTLICDARRNSWNAFPVPAPRAAKIEIVATEDLPAENRSIVTFETFQRWSKIDSISRELPYEPELAFANEPLELLRPLDFASPLTLRESDFKKWTPKIHQATTE